MSAANTSAVQEKVSGSAIYALIALLLAYILSFIDRNVMAVLIGPIREDFAISDFQYSLLHGFAFSMFYIFLGLPIARLADRGNRKWVITAGIFFWSLMTCVCGVTRNFTGLFLARVGVGVGEAALSPPAYSLLSDYFNSERLPRAMAIYTLGITIGGGLAYIIGGAVYEYFTLHGALTLPLVGELRPWQTTFVIVGLPGFLLVLMLSMMKEPARQGAAQAASEHSLDEVGAHLRSHWQAYGSLIAGVSLLSVLGYGTMAWYPEFLVRNHGMNRGDAGSAFGLIFIFAGSAGTLLGGFSAKPLHDRGYQDGSMRIIIAIALLWLVPAALGPLSSTSEWALWAGVPIVFFLNSYFALAISSLQSITPNRMRAQISALMLFMTNLFGLAIGPSAVAAITDFVFANDAALAYSLCLLPLIVCPLAAGLLAWGLPYYRAALADNAVGV
ncbi:MAG: MFS family permease [Halioglobus sp.]|jgi:MFS family permease